jgi:hypothetical protein
MTVYNFFKYNLFRQKDWAWHEANINLKKKNFESIFDNHFLYTDTVELDGAINDARNYLNAKPDGKNKQTRLASLNKYQSAITQLKTRISDMNKVKDSMSNTEAMQVNREIASVVIGKRI